MFLQSFQTENFLLCKDAVPNFLNFFDTTVAPPLLFYSYLPVVIVLLALSIFVFLKSEKKQLAKFLLMMSVSFAAWLMIILFQWTAIHANIVMLAWQLTPIFELSTYIFAVAFLYYFFTQKPIAPLLKTVIALIVLPVIVLLPTQYNAQVFDIVNCEAWLGQLWSYVYLLEAILTLSTLYILCKWYGDVKARGQHRVGVILTLGTFFFLGFFFVSEFVGELTRVYEINLIGPIGAVLFVLLVTYSIVRFKTFALKIFGVQALIIALWMLVFSLLFVRTLSLVQTVVLVTLALITVVGFMLIRGFNREVKQREEITKLAHDLQSANARLKELDKQKSEFVSLASHQLRGPITAINGYIGMVLSGEYGQVFNPEVKEVLTKVQTAGKDLGVLVGDYLDVTRIELGRMQYAFADVSITQLARDVFDQMLPVTQRAQLELVAAIPEEQIMVHADANKLKQVMLNLADNAVKYTPSGKITICVAREGHKVRFSVTDTGTGMSQKVLESIFEKFVRAPGAQRINATGTGLGLFVARKIITEHKGRIWAESAGEGKGSTFSFEIDILG